MTCDKEVITSPQNKFVSLARGLANKKNRENEKLFRFDGIKLMCEAVKKEMKIRFALTAENEWNSVLEKAEKLYGISENDLEFPIFRVARSVFERLSDEMSPEGVICVAEYAMELHRDCREASFEMRGSDEKILILESVRDPQNVGAIIRVASAFGVDRVIMSRDCADIYNSKTIRASMGTLFSVRIDRVDSIVETVGVLRDCGRRVMAAALDRDSKRLGEIEIAEGDCVIIGNEGHGLSAETISACNNTVFIPMAEGVESLNAATAAAVLVWEFFGKVSKEGL